MPSIDMPLEELRKYKPALTRQADFESFWEKTIAEALAQPLNAELIPYPFPARDVDVFAVRFDGFGGGRIAGWYLRPKGEGPFPGVCQYHGYCGRGPRPLDMLPLASQGIASLSMDCRGQLGDSQDVRTIEGGQHPGWMTSGVRNPKEYYYRYVYADAVRALEVLARRSEIDPQRLAITGISQGGGITLATAALSDRPLLALPRIPFLCNFPRSLAITPAGPYPDITNYLRYRPDLEEITYRTLSYVDCMNLAPWIKCEIYVSNCLCDDICPPSTVFSAYNHMSCVKQMEIYPFHKHEVIYEDTERCYRKMMETLKP
ncbi:MAG: acetylxylan esterase [Phycisphaerales bacterium]|nr:acetylxylan esterase [Phycisphaerales bacterium]